MINEIDGSEIAIVGMAGRFPGAKNIEAFWRNLRDGVESITFFSDEESGVTYDMPRDSNYVRAAGLLEGADLFDASFFAFNAREAEIMDPQHRVLLECAWEAVENAGYNSETYKGVIGVYAGATINTYLLLNLLSNPQLIRSLEDVQVNVANGGDFLTTRVSYKLNLKGPSHLVQSACSTSLVAVHTASQSLLSEECDMALAGGVSINVKLSKGYRYVTGGMASPDGHCRAFDARAQGTIFSSGVGIVVLKRLEDALAERDSIYAVIKGSAINNDGSVKVGYTAPGIEGQAGVIIEALANAGVEAETISYVETHGTGTPLGDPIEIQALTKAFRASTEKKNFCAVGSVKTNIGHLDAAAGVASLIKTVLALKHKMIPPSLHFQEPNPKIDFASSPFYVNSELREWEQEAGRKRRAGVSAFGVGGTNAHVVLEEAPEQEGEQEGREWKIIALSARSGEALERATENLMEEVRGRRGESIADIGYTLLVGRRRFSHRRVMICRDKEELKGLAEGKEAGRVMSEVQEASNRPVVFMFPGQGSQYAGMALELYQDEPAFRSQVDHCSELLQDHLGFDLRTVLCARDEDLNAATHKLTQTEVTQPALFVTEYSLARLYMSWGIYPQAMIGHSIGEYVAACLAGVFSLEDALALVSARGKMIQELPGGSMLAVPLPASELQSWLNKGLDIAAINGPMQCVISGSSDSVDELEAWLAQNAVSCRRLSTSHAFHSRMMDPILESFTERVRHVKLNPPEIPHISNVTGTWMASEQATSPEYWARQLRQSVRFADGLTELSENTERVLLEVGPGRTLSKLAKRHSSAVRQQKILYSLPATDDPQPDTEFLITVLGKLWLAGAQIDWPAFYSLEKRRRVPLTSYPFERQRYWIEAKQGGENEQREGKGRGERADIGEWYYIPSWRRKMIGGKRRGEGARRWMVVKDEEGVGEEIAEELRRRGEEVIEVGRGEDASEELKKEAERGGVIDELVHCLSITEGEDERSTGEAFEQAQENGFYSLLSLARLIGKENITRAIRISVISNWLWSITDQEVSRPEKATILGPCKVIPQEFPTVTCCCIDIAIPAKGSPQRTELASRLLAEINARASDVVAYRGSQRWIQVFDPVILEGAVDAKSLRENGVYLIAGGMAGIVGALAGHLAKTAQAKLLIIERHGFPQRSNWKQWLSIHPDQDRISQKIRRIEEAESGGSEVVIVNADITDNEEMREVVDQAVRRFGDIHGLIYATGMDEKDAFNSIQEITRSKCERQFQQNIDGLYALESAIGNRPLDFCVLVSSLSSILGGLGSVAHTSMSLFIDAFAANHNSRGGVSWVSVNWDAWQFKEEREQLTAISEELFRLAMTSEEGGVAFERILSLGPIDQIVVSTANLDERINQWIRGGVSRRSAQPEIADRPATRHARPELQSALVSPRTEIEINIASVWQEALGIDYIGINDNFFDLGGDSLTAIQVASQLKRRLGLDVPVVSLYESLTVSSLAALLQPEDEAVTTNDNRNAKISRRKEYQQKQRAKRKIL